MESYYLVRENEALIKALVNVAGSENEARKVASSLGYKYSVKQEDAQKNVLRAVRFANVFSPYSEVLSSYARTGGNPTLLKLSPDYRDQEIYARQVEAANK